MFFILFSYIYLQSNFSQMFITEHITTFIVIVVVMLLIYLKVYGVKVSIFENVGKPLRYSKCSPYKT